MILGTASPEHFRRTENYQWAHDMYKQSVANTWFPEEQPLSEDLPDFESLTDDEKHIFEMILAFFNPAEFIVNRSIALGVYPNITSPEAHMYTARWMMEEANHSETMEYVLQSFPVDRDKIYNMFTDYKSTLAKDKFLEGYIKSMSEGDVDIDTVEGKQQFIKNLIATNVVAESIWFYGGFMVILAFRQRNKMKNFANLIKWILRDESLHIAFGMQLILTSLEENPDIVTDEFAEEIRSMILQGVELEMNYNKEILPNGVLGLNTEYCNQYIQYIADRRLEELGFEPEYNVENPAKFMTIANDQLELVNFFETVNTNYEVNANASAEK